MYFPRHILHLKHKYVGEGMEVSIYRKYGIDSDCVHTEVRMATIAYCIGVGVDEMRDDIAHWVSKYGCEKLYGE